MEFTFEDLGIKPSSGNGGYNPLIPPVEHLADGTLEITGWAQNTKLTGFNYENDNAIFSFEADSYTKNVLTAEDGVTEEVTYTEKDANGNIARGSIRKYIQDPLERNHIKQMDDTNPKKKELVGYTYNEVISLFKNFVKPYLVDAAVREIKPITMQSLTTELYKLMSNPDNLSDNNVLLKVAFQKESGVEPKFTVPQNRYLGNINKDGKKYEPIWSVNSEKPQYSDKKNFSFEEKTPDFLTLPTAGIPMVDGAADLPFGDVAPAPTLNTPDVDLLS